VIDGIKLSSEIDDLKAWKEATGISLYSSTDRDTGEIKSKHFDTSHSSSNTINYRGKFETYELIVKEVQRYNRLTGKASTNCYLTIEGSLHKNHYGGKNYLPFPWQLMQSQINHLCTSLRLNPKLVNIRNIEIGVNIQTLFKPFNFLQSNLINYKGEQFSKYKPDRNGISIGYVCDEPAQYSVNIYDKGLQNNLSQNLLRFELRIVKMQKLKSFNIRTLADLTDFNKVIGLIDLLLTGWKNILLHDCNIDIENLPINNTEKELLKDGYNPKFWHDLKTNGEEQFKYKRRLYRSLIACYGEGGHAEINRLIGKAWKELTESP
jgi:hypothetical protein